MTNEMQQFDGEVRRSGKRLFVPVPFDPNTVWGPKDRHHVSGTVNGVKIRGPLGNEDGEAILSLPAAWIRDTPIAAGVTVTVVLWPEGPQLDALPEDIAAALVANPAASAFFESLAQFYRKAYLTWLAGSARRPDVRAARIAEFIELLSAGKKQR